MKPGDLVVVAGLHEFGKPRPGLVLQNYSVAGYPTVTYVPLTSILYHQPLVRVPIAPTQENGLHKESEIMIDRIQTVVPQRLGDLIGRVDAETMDKVKVAISMFLGLV